MAWLDYLDRIQRSLDYIEEHITESITTEELASQSGFSPYHYYRIFGAYVGMPVMEYIRRRRLAYAATELSTNRRILDIALDYGFQTHAGFTKAFLKVYGLPPERYRIHANGRLPDKVNLARFTQYKIEGGIIMEPKIVEKPAVKIAGYALETTTENGENNRQIPLFWQEYISEERYKILQDQPSTINPNEYGICLPMDIETNRFIYCIGVEVSDFEGLDSNLFTTELPAATYAVFTTPPAVREKLTKNIQSTWQYIYNEWFPKSSYEFAPGCADFELYDERCMGDTDLVIDIYIPVVQK